MEFTAEVKQVQARKVVSNDVVYKLILETDNPLILDLGKLPSDSLFNVKIEIEGSDG